MSIESARVGLLAVFAEALQGALTTGTGRGGGFADEIDAIILEVQAAMPCFRPVRCDDDHTYFFRKQGDNRPAAADYCLSCAAREQLKSGVPV
jgi:hypothetical protein